MSSTWKNVYFEKLDYQDELQDLQQWIGESNLRTRGNDVRAEGLL